MHIVKSFLAIKQAIKKCVPEMETHFVRSFFLSIALYDNY